MAEEEAAQAAAAEPANLGAWRRPWVVVTGIVGAVVVAGVIGLVIGRSTSDRDQVATGTTVPEETTTTAPATTTTASAAPTAADGLAPFFAAAKTNDAALRQAAALINAGTHGDTITVDPAMVDAVAASATTVTARAVPAGLPDDLQRAVLLVYSDLESRWTSIRCLGQDVGTKAIADLEPGCFQAGGAAAARFADDLAAAQRLASSMPPFAVAAPDSTAAEEVAARIAAINIYNGGCAATGGYIATELIPVVVYPQPTFEDRAGRLVDGHVGNAPDNTISFEATYLAGDGWTIMFNAC